jgi:hypothetical protein
MQFCLEVKASGRLAPAFDSFSILRIIRAALTHSTQEEVSTMAQINKRFLGVGLARRLSVEWGA